ncbi:MAG: type II toxin-antitoxin system VapC family toxin [Rhodothermales bacterium]
MILVDVNVLVYAHRADTDRHEEYRAWLEALWAAPSTHAVSEMVLSGCLRIITHHRVFDPPTPLKQALGFVDQVRSRPNAVTVAPGARHWDIFTDLCRKTEAAGNLVPDAYLAALAIESGSELITTDRDFARFPHLRWRHPLK